MSYPPVQPPPLDEHEHMGSDGAKSESGSEGEAPSIADAALQHDQPKASASTAAGASGASSAAVEVAPSEAASSPAPSVIINLTPESNRDYANDFDKSFASPSPAARRASTGPGSSPSDASYQRVPSSSPEAFVSANSLSEHSSFDLLQHHHAQSGESSRRSSADSAPPGANVSATSTSRVGRILPTSLLSFATLKKVTLSAPPPFDPLSPSKTTRSRAWSAIAPNRPTTFSKGLLAASDGEAEFAGDRVRRRASHDGSPVLNRRRSSITPGLSPIPDERIVGRSAFKPAHLFDKLSQVDSFSYILANGKNEFGDLTRDAREALKSVGLKSIPSMHGPLSLPYARCPSGIDAFLFSVEKDEDPYTFLLDDVPRCRPRPFTKSNPIALPGNARYSQPAQIQQGRLPNNRIVSAPAMLRTTAEEASPMHTRPPSAAGPRSRKPTPAPEKAASVAQILAAHRVQYGDEHQPAPYSTLYYIPSTSLEDWGYRAPSVPIPADPYALGSSVPYPSPYPPAYAWPNYPYPSYTYPSLPPYIFSHPTYAPQAYQQPAAFVDPAIISYGANPKDLDAGTSSYYTADESEDEDAVETQHGGFFFPAIPPRVPAPSAGPTWSRRTSTSTAHPAASTVPRRPSIIPLPHPLLPVANADRRNSAAPGFADPRRMSSAPAVTVSPKRRSSVVPTMRVGGGMDAGVTRHPRPPPVEQEARVPHHSRPASLSSLAAAARALRRQASTGKAVLGEANGCASLGTGGGEGEKEKGKEVGGERAVTPGGRSSTSDGKGGRGGRGRGRGRGKRGGGSGRGRGAAVRGGDGAGAGGGGE